MIFKKYTHNDQRSTEYTNEKESNIDKPHS